MWLDTWTDLHTNHSQSQVWPSAPPPSLVVPLPCTTSTRCLLWAGLGRAAARSRSPSRQVGHRGRAGREGHAPIGLHGNQDPLIRSLYTAEYNEHQMPPSWTEASISTPPPGPAAAQPTLPAGPVPYWPTALMRMGPPASVAPAG